MNDPKVKLPEIGDELYRELRTRYMMCSEKVKGHLPLIMNESVYMFFGERVKIVEVHIYDKVENAEVVVENSMLDRHSLQFDELTISMDMKLIDLGTKRPQTEIIQIGTLEADE